MAGDQRWQPIPTQLELAEFERFILPHLAPGRRGPAPKLGLHKIFNYVLKHVYLGCPRKELPIGKDSRRWHHGGGEKGRRQPRLQRAKEGEGRQGRRLLRSPVQRDRAARGCGGQLQRSPAAEGVLSQISRADMRHLRTRLGLSRQRIELPSETHFACRPQLTFADHVHEFDASKGYRG